MANHDIIIIGAGPAGMTSALYAARSGLSVALVSKDIGGTANSILLFENWPGFSGTGAELMKQFYAQLKEYKITFVMDEVEGIMKKSKDFIVKTKKQQINGRAIILASGTERKKLNIKGEKELTGKGVSYCVTCDAFFFKNKIAAVIGGSDCAAVSALALSDLAKKVYIIYRGEKLKCEDINSQRLEQKQNTEIIYNAIPKEIKGEEKVEGLIIQQGKNNNEIKLDGLFIEVGAVPLIKFAEKLKLKLNKQKYIVVDENMKTSVSGIFAAGDVINRREKQVVTSSGQGAIAAKSAYEFLK